MQIPSREQCIENSINADAIEKQVMQLLMYDKPERYIEACDLLDSNKCSEIAKHNQRIYILTIISVILRAEVKEGIDNNICRGRTIDEIIELYKVMVMLFRRMEFDMPSDLCMDILEVIRNENISMMAAIGIVQSSTSLIDKEKIRKGLISLISQGWSNDGQ